MLTRLVICQRHLGLSVDDKYLGLSCFSLKPISYMHASAFGEPLFFALLSSESLVLWSL